MKTTKILLIILVGFILIPGCQIDIKSNCFGASSPVDLEIANTTDKKVQLVFVVFANDGEFDKLGKLKLKPNQTEVICLENEGNITNGLYIYFNKTLSKIKLSNTEKNKFDIGDIKSQVDLTEELIKELEK